MSGVISRDPLTAASRQFDVVVVGGGFYGATLTLEAARRGLRPLLIESGDFGHATSWNSLRIVHGGLRYLQSLDLRRYFESVRERKWFLQHFPSLVKPLTCVMPLYDEGLYRRSVFSIALRLNDGLSANRNRGVTAECRLPGGRVISSSDTADLFPAVDRKGLRGGALWFDAAMPDSQRVLIEILRWAVEAGAVALNYVQAEELIETDGRAAGVVARDRETDNRLEFRAPLVVNCAGPWSRDIATKFDRDVSKLFCPSIAFNLFLDRRPDFKAAVALRPRVSGARTYFLYPWKGKLLAGTYHAPRTGGKPDGSPSQAMVNDFLGHLRTSIAGFDVTEKDVLRVHWGVLPAAVEGTEHPAKREVLYSHGKNGGPQGLYSVSGVKLTTARLVAEKVLRMIFAERAVPLPPASGLPVAPTAEPPGVDEFLRLLADDTPEAHRTVRRIVSEEAVVRLEDILLRRTDWGMDPNLGEIVGRKIESLLDRDPAFPH